MTDPQLRLYRYEVARWRAARKTAGQPAREEDRHALHRKALGYDKSSLTLTNAELDKVLGALRATSQPGNLKAQLHVEESEDQRKAAALTACLWECTLLWRLGDNRLDCDNRPRYIAGCCRRINQGREPEACTSAELAKVLGALKASVVRAKLRNPAAAHSMDHHGQPYTGPSTYASAAPALATAAPTNPAAYAPDERPW